MSDLKNRARFTTSLDIELLKKLKSYSKKSLIPMSKLLDKAIRELLESAEK